MVIEPGFLRRFPDVRSPFANLKVINADFEERKKTEQGDVLYDIESRLRIIARNLPFY